MDLGLSSFGGRVPRAFNKLEESLDVCVGDLIVGYNCSKFDQSGVMVRIDLEVGSGTQQVNTSVPSGLNSDKPPQRGTRNSLATNPF